MITSRHWRPARGNRPSSQFRLNRSSPFARNLVSWVPLTRGSGVQDRAQQIGLPVAVNGPSLRGLPEHGLVYDFTAANDQYVDLGNPLALQITNAISISCWYRLITVPLGFDGFSLVAKDADTGGRAYTLEVQGSNGSPVAGGARFYVNGGVSSSDLVVESIQPVVGNICHVLGTYSPSAIALYVNGRSIISQAPGSASISAASTNALIGRRNYAGFTNPFDGQIWDVRIWNRTLTAADAWALYAPQSRWDLYAVPTTRVVWDAGAAAPPPSRVAGLMSHFGVGF